MSYLLGGLLLSLYFMGAKKYGAFLALFLFGGASFLFWLFAVVAP